MDDTEKQVFSIHSKTNDEVLDTASEIRETTIRLTLVWLDMLNPRTRRNLSHADLSYLKNLISITTTYLIDNPGDFKGARELMISENWPIFEDDED